MSYVPSHNGTNGSKMEDNCFQIAKLILAERNRPMRPGRGGASGVGPPEDSGDSQKDKNESWGFP